jgi:hypothetical protein
MLCSLRYWSLGLLLASTAACTHPGTDGKAKKRGLDTAGIATLPDGKSRPFTELWYLDPPIERVGFLPAGGGDSSVFIFREMVLVRGGADYNVKEKAVPRDKLYRLSFSPVKRQPLEPIGEIQRELAYSDVELESIDGKKEAFPCVLQDMTMRVQYADGIGKEKLTGSQLGGITFRARD